MTKMYMYMEVFQTYTPPPPSNWSMSDDAPDRKDIPIIIFIIIYFMFNLLSIF